MTDDRFDDIAIVGLNCRFPGARDSAEYWKELVAGVDAITRLTDEQLAAAGVPEHKLRDPHYVKAAPLVDDMEGFDARFFGYTPREAEIRDPQGRMFLESCYAAIEDAGHDLEELRQSSVVGVFGGMANNRYGTDFVARNAAVKAAIGEMAIEVSNSPDYLTTTVAYRLGLRGPAINVQTACSSALVALHLACQSLRTGECDAALAGGVEVELPYGEGYLWTDGGIYSRDGRCRSFDAQASGTIFGSGVGVVLLKRLRDAQASGDHIYAVVRGSAVNNDGADRAGFTAPSVNGQAALIAEALAVADVHPDTIGFVEAHATGTLVGDPIEVDALTQAFRQAGATGTGTCPIGSVKPNIGHLGPASGIAGLIKVCLMFKHDLIPPNIHFSTPNPRLGLAESPFYVVTHPTAWPRGDAPRRAGVSSFGIGGTNAHVILEEPPPSLRPTGAAGRWHLLPVSAKTDTGLAAAGSNLADHLASCPDADLADIAYTLQVGRTAFAHRRAVIARSAGEAASTLRTPAAGRSVTSSGPVRPRGLAMMFPGQGSQHPGMGADLYHGEPVFRDAVDRCAEIIRAHTEIDLCRLLYGPPESVASVDQLQRTSVAQPALFTVEYAMACLLAKWGIEPSIMIGHSLGEYVAAHLAGVFTLDDAIAVVCARGALMDQMPRGAMAALPLPAERVVELLGGDVEIAAANSPMTTVVAGPRDDVAGLCDRLARMGIASTPLHTSHAFHSAMMAPMLEPFRAAVAAVARRAPTISFISNVTGAPITDEQARDPGYWAGQVRATVRFGAGLAALVADRDVALVEVGPGDALSKLARQGVGHLGLPIVPTMRHQQRRVDDDQVLAHAVGALWVGGALPNWHAYSTSHGRRARRPLPVYPFERSSYLVRPDEPSVAGIADTVEVGGPLPVERAAFAPLWREVALPVGRAPAASGTWLILGVDAPPIAALAARVAGDGARVITVGMGSGFACVAPDGYVVSPEHADDMDLLCDAIEADGLPTRIVHAFAAGEPAPDPLDPAEVARTAETGFYSLLRLLQRIGNLTDDLGRDLYVVTANADDVTGTDAIEPAKALTLGPVLLAARELPRLTCRGIDLAAPSRLPAAETAEQLLSEIALGGGDQRVAWRGRRRWVWTHAPVGLPPVPAQSEPVRDGDTVLITGGLGGIGLAVAQDLARTARCNLVLLGRTPPPPRTEWPALLSAPDTPGSLRLRLRRLMALEETGATLLIEQADVADEARLREVVARVHQRFGRIRAVIHSAGQAGGGMLAVRQRADAEAVLAPKVAGTLALHRVLGAEVETMVLFSSIIAVTGDLGLVDYCAANSFLDAYARWAEAAGRRVISIGWAGWLDFGMAAETDTSAPMAFREMQSGIRYEAGGHPLLDRRVIDRSGDVVYSTYLRPDSHWTIAEHHVGDVSVLPGAAMLEMVHAAHRQAIGGAVDLVDAVFLGPVGITEPTEVRVVLRPDSAGTGFDATVAATPLAAGARAWTPRLTVRVVPRTVADVPAHDLAAITARCSVTSVSEAELEAPDRLVRFGPHWHNVTSTIVGVGEELSRVELDPAFASECDEFVLHPSLFDDAVSNGQYTPIARERGENHVPFSYGRVRVHRALPARFYTHVRHLDDAAGEFMTVDITLIDDDGSELARVDAYAMRRVDPQAFLADVVAMPEDTPATSLGIEDRIDALDFGISEADGIEALRRLWHWRPRPHVVYCPEGLGRALARVAALTAASLETDLAFVGLGTESATGRDTDTAFVAPRTDLERVLCALWGHVLGIAEIGVDDDFFELGGNSLVAVQLATRVRERFLVQLPMAVLFEHPTVRDIAEVLTGMLADRGSTPHSGAEPIAAAVGGAR